MDKFALMKQPLHLVMLKFYFDKPKTVFKVNWRLPLLPCASPFHSLAEVMGSFKIYWHMAIKGYGCQDTGGGSTYPLAHLTPLSPTKKAIDTSKNSHKLNTLVLNPEHAVLIKLTCNSFLIWRKGNLQAS